MTEQDALATFSGQFHAEVASSAHALEMLREHAFVERMSEVLIEYGELGSCEPCHFKARGMKVDAYDFDDEYTAVTLVVSHWLDEGDPSQARVTNTEVDRQLKWCQTFLERALSGRLADQIEVSNPAHDVAELIHECRKTLTSAKLVLVTDGLAAPRPAGTHEAGGLEVRSVIWDVGRLHAFETSGEREQLTVDFASGHGGALPCLGQPSPDGTYVTYLAFVPGAVLADLYARWKIRLLERNVRVFLSQRPKVNQGIRDTILGEPGMFCAYNNGITVSARAVTLTGLPGGGEGIAQVADFQIVNGGQTTASLYHTRERSKKDLDGITVQMKLMVIDDEQRPAGLPPDQRLSDVLVPKIGLYSNTQNRVQMADLLANDPPHPELHTISLNTPAPDPTGGSAVTYWFYERSRGSYEETRRMTAKTPAQQRKYDAMYPRAQRFDKSKFGKAWNSYRKLPHVVSLGAMKNFAHFNVWLREQPQEDWHAFFRKTVGLLALWNEAERTVRRQKFGGYTHAIVTYSLAWLHHLTGMRLDLERLWREQKPDDALREAIEALAAEVNEHVRDTKLNVTEWCKKTECWEALLQRRPPGLPDLSQAFYSGASPAVDIGPPATERENVEFCVAQGPDAWFELSQWLKERDFMQGKQRSQAYNMGKIILQGREPSAVLSFACRDIWEKAKTGYGWEPVPAGG